MNGTFIVLDIGIAMGLIMTPAVIAMVISLRCLDFPDLGIEASLPLGGAIAAVALAGGLPSIVCLALASSAGALVGAITATVHARLGISKLLSGVIILALFYSINLRVMGGPNVSLLGKETLFDALSGFDSLTSEARWIRHLHPGRLLFLFAVATTIVGVCRLLLRTLPGLRLQSVGSNPQFARSLGVSTSNHVSVGLACTNALAGLSGGLLAMHQGFADVGMGFGVLVVTIASMAIGERLVSWLRGWSRVTCLLTGAVLGSVVYQSLIVVALRAGLPATDLKMATAVLVLLFMALQRRGLAVPFSQRGY